MTIANFFVPNRQIIDSITNANPGVVTTTQDHGYLTGLFVRLTFPVSFGMPNVNNQVFEITVLSSNTFSIPVNTTNFAPFAIINSLQSPQVIPVAEEAFSLSQAVENNGNIPPETTFITT